jgi:hypothetical protein
MFTNALLQYYESLVKAQTTAPLPEDRHVREYVCELRDQWEKRVIVRELRLRAGMPVCCGEVDCLENPSSLCMRGEHPTVPPTPMAASCAIPHARISIADARCQTFCEQSPWQRDRSTLASPHESALPNQRKCRTRDRSESFVQT